MILEKIYTSTHQLCCWIKMRLIFWMFAHERVGIDIGVGYSHI